MSEIFRFETFELDRSAYELRRDGAVVRLERIPLDLLFLLVERRGTLVTRQEILERIWGKDVALDVDTSINTAIRKIRRALNDDPDNPSFLATISGKGYRFTLPVVETALPAASVTEPPASPPVAIPTEPRSPRRWMLWTALAGSLASIVLLFAGRPLLRPFRPASGKMMLVVLPFVNLSGDPRQDYFADGMTEETITELGSLDPSHLGVIARTSAMQYKGARKTTAQIAGELGVNYLLEGSIRREGERIRVTAQLIQASDQTHLWAESFDRDVRDLLKIEADVARAIAGKTQLALSQQAEARLARTMSVNPEAHEAYLQGLKALNLRTTQGSEAAIANFERAIAVDPNYAPAYAGLARVYSLADTFLGLNPAEFVPRARNYAMRAVSLDGSLADAHTTLAFVKAYFEGDWPGGEREFLRALELNPSDANCHFFYSNGYLQPLGRHDEAIAEMKRAIELDPLSLPIQSYLGRSFILARRYDQALAQLQKVDRMDPKFAINHQRLANVYVYTGRFEDAIGEETKARMLSGQDPQASLAKADELRRSLGARGPRGYWEKMLEFSRTDQHLPESFANRPEIIYAQLGEKQKALDLLEMDLSGLAGMVELSVEPLFDPLRSDPRFVRMLRTSGLLR